MQNKKPNDTKKTGGKIVESAKVSDPAKPGTERHRDEQRDENTARVHGHPWRAPELPESGGDPLASEDTESSPEHEGMGRGEKPRKMKDREP